MGRAYSGQGIIMGDWLQIIGPLFVLLAALVPVFIATNSRISTLRLQVDKNTDKLNGNLRALVESIVSDMRDDESKCENCKHTFAAINHRDNNSSTK